MWTDWARLACKATWTSMNLKLWICCWTRLFSVQIGLRDVEHPRQFKSLPIPMFPLFQLKKSNSVKHSNPTRIFFFFRAPRSKFMLKASQCWHLQCICCHLEFFHLSSEGSFEPCFLFWKSQSPPPCLTLPPQTLQRPQQHLLESETLMSSLGTRSQVSCAMLLPLRRMRKHCQSLFLLSFLVTISQLSTTLMTFKNKNVRPSIFSSSHPLCVWYVYSNI